MIVITQLKLHDYHYNACYNQYRVGYFFGDFVVIFACLWQIVIHPMLRRTEEERGMEYMRGIVAVADLRDDLIDRKILPKLV